MGQTGLFAAMCLIWGTTWVAMKLGVASVPPIFFAGTRFVAAGTVLMAYAWATNRLRRLDRQETQRLLLIQLTMLVLTYAPLFWAMPYVPTGLSAVLNMALMPVCLVTFGVMLGEERWTTRRLAALALGFVGLAVLFGPQVTAPTGDMALLGSAAVVFSAVIYCLGSVIARPLTKTLDPIALSGMTMLPGGLALTALGLLVEPGAPAATAFDWPIAAWAGWLFLVIAGSLIAFTIYLRLIAAWGPARAGTYAYVSPVIAVLVGVLVLHEHMSVRDGIGMALLLAAAITSLRAVSASR